MGHGRSSKCAQGRLPGILCSVRACHATAGSAHRLAATAARCANSRGLACTPAGSLVDFAGLARPGPVCLLFLIVPKIHQCCLLLLLRLALLRLLLHRWRRRCLIGRLAEAASGRLPLQEDHWGALTSLSLRLASARAASLAFRSTLAAGAATGCGSSPSEPKRSSTLLIPPDSRGRRGRARHGKSGVVGIFGLINRRGQLICLLVRTHLGR